MKKGNFKFHNQEYNGFIIIENMSDLIDYFHESLYGIQKETAQKLVSRARHKKNDIQSPEPIIQIIEMESNLKGNGAIYNLAKLFATVQDNWIEIINKGLTLVVNPSNGISYFCISKSVIVDIISEKETYTEADIKVLRWSGGSHWYAKVGYIDVVIDGEVKWNAKWVAEEKAKQFLLTLK